MRSLTRATSTYYYHGCLGRAVDAQKTAEVALWTSRRANAMLSRLGQTPSAMIVHHDEDSAFMSYEWAHQLVQVDDARLSFARNGAKDNPEMESFFGRLRGENRSLLLDAKTVDELEEVVGKRTQYYKRERRRQSLKNEAPMRYAKGC